MKATLSYFWLILIGLVFFSQGNTQINPIDHLIKEVQQLEEISGGTMGVGIFHLESKRSYMYNRDKAFPMASTYKIPVAVRLLNRVEKGELTLDSLIHLEPKDIHPGSGTISRLLDDPGVALSIHNLLELMMLISDNSATDLCIKLAGGPAAINKMLESNDIYGISVDRPTVALIANYLGIDLDPNQDMTMAEFEEAYDAMKETEREKAMDSFSRDPRDQSTPEAMTKLLQMIWDGELMNEANTQLLLDIMYRCETGNERLKGLLPPDTPIAHKTGTIGGTTNDVGIIDLPDGAGHVVVVAFVKESKKEIAERESAISHIARAIYDYFLFVRE